MAKTRQLLPIDRAAALIASAPVVAIDAALAAFGDTRGHRSDPDTEHYLDVLAQAILRASGVRLASDEQALEVVFAETSCDNLAAAAFLRLLVLDDTVYDEQHLRNRAVVLFDRKVGPRAYDRLKLAANSQTFEKRDRLRSALEHHESALMAHIDSLSTVSALPAFRQRLLQLFNDSYSLLAIRPFLPPGTNQQRFSDLLGATETALAAPPERILLEVEHAEQLFDAAEAESLSWPTSYCQAFLGGLQSRLRDLLSQYVREQGLADPANLSISKRAKLYPLREQGASVVLRFDVENAGPGHASNVEIAVEGQQLLRLETANVQIDRLQMGSEEVDIRAIVSTAGDGDAVLLRVTWRNPDGTHGTTEEIIELEAQTSDVPWDEIEYENPYSLDPVKGGDGFVGRETVLRELAKVVLGAEPGNATIFGQKRVGKTSVGYALRALVESLKPGIYSFLFAECGDFNLNTPEDTLARLGRRLCELAIAADESFADVPVPDFDKGLAPLTDFFETVSFRAPDRKFVVVLDEFDAMAHREIYDRGTIGTTFFQTLRSLGGKRNVGFVLIGSERMRPVLVAQEQEINKFRSVQIDYFTERQYDDYAELVTGPVSQWISIDPDAVHELYLASAGNPYITKAVGITLFDRCVAAHDGDVRRDEAVEAIAAAVPQLGARAFAHFWDDGIVGDAEEQHLVSLARRRVLLGLANCLRDGRLVTEVAVADAARQYGVDRDDAIEVLRSFRERQILTETPAGELVCRVPLFARWLVDEGVHEIVVTMGDDDAILRRVRAEEEARIRIPDVEPIAKAWGTYRGAAVTPEHLREWLRQFGAPTDQRLMLKMLAGIDFYNGSDLRAQLRELYAYVLRDLKERRGYEFTFRGRQQTRADMVVTALDDGGSGATHLLKPFRDENRIAAGRVLPAADVPAALAASKDPIQALLILEDFLGTGKTAEAQLRKLHKHFCVDNELPGNIDTYILVVTGFDDAANYVRGVLGRLRWEAHVHVARPLDSADRCFSANSRIFPEEAECARARALALDHGRELSKRHPLGHESTEAVVVFESRCPNNTLPILWANSETWRPLFPRH